MDDEIKIEVAIMKNDIKNICGKIDELKDTVEHFINSADKKYAGKDDFILWRNLLIIGILGTIFTTIIVGQFK